MRVLALGGCGGVGRYAVRALLGDSRIDHVVIADLDGERAAAFAQECGPRVSGRQVDVSHAPSLGAAMADGDIVMNCVGPYFRFGVAVLRASLEAGRHYVDVCDDWAPTLEMLALDEVARDRGVSALVGMGITPGVSNLLAALAVQELDEPQAVVTGWNLEAAMPETVGPEPSAATLHGVEQLTGTIRVLRAGRFVDERPIRTVRFEYPGIGRARAWTIGHPEPVTLLRTFPTLQESVNVMVARPRTVCALRVLRALVDLRWVSPRRAARWAERFGGEGGHTPRLDALIAAARRRGRMGLPPIFAVAQGLRDGRTESVGAMLLSAPAGGIGGTTGVPLAVGAGLLAAGAIGRTGVFAPEAGVDPARFFAALAPHCDPPRASGSDMVLVTRSWEPSALLDELIRETAGQR